MTIGIGVICDSGNSIILASDTRASYDEPQLAPNDQTGKMFDLPHEFRATIAGTIIYCGGVVSQLYTEFTKLPQPFFQDHVRIAMNNARFYERDFRASERMREHIGLTLPQWQTGPLDHRVYRLGKAILKCTTIDVAILVAGFSNGGVTLLRSCAGQPIEQFDSFSVVGSGWEKALNRLNKRGQQAHFGLARSLIHTAEALRDSQRTDKAIGPFDYPNVIRLNENQYFQQIVLK